MCLKDYRIRSDLSYRHAHGDLCKHLGIVYFQRCIVMRLFYFSYKQVKHDFSLLSAYAIICGRFNITVN